MRLANLAIDDHGRATVAGLSGEIDLSNAENIGSAIDVAISNQVSALVLDLTEIEYLDSAGIQLIYRLRESVRSRGQRMLLVIPPESRTIDALTIAGATSQLEVHDTLEGALEDLSPEKLASSEAS